jgi:hypothetical protein
LSKRPTALSVSLTNGTIVSALCLAGGSLAEWVRGRYGFRWAERVSLVSEALPARVLEWLSLLPKLREALNEQRLSVFQVRLIYALTTTVSIFALALSTGAFLSAIGWLVRKNASAKET